MTGCAEVNELSHSGTLIPASNPGGISAILAITPEPSDDDSDSAATISELREDRF